MNTQNKKNNSKNNSIDSCINNWNHKYFDYNKP